MNTRIITTLVLLLCCILLAQYVINKLSEAQAEERRERAQLSQRLMHTAAIAVRAEGLAVQAIRANYVQGR